MTAAVQSIGTGLVIGLLGQKQSGKDSFAKYLTEDHAFMRHAYADAMKDSLYALDPYVFGANERLSIITKRMGWDRAKEQYPEVRRLLQRFGTEVGRDILGEDIWTQIMATKLERARKAGANVVVTDVRFLNEASLITAHGGILVRVDRPGLPDEDQHRSEQEWREIKPFATITNSGTLEDLRQTCGAFMSELKERGVA